MTHSMNLFEQFRSAEEAISKEFPTQGGFTLFGLFERDDVPGKFDVIASARWLKPDRLSLIQLTEMVRQNIATDNWWSRVGKFVVLTEDDPLISAVLSRLPGGPVAHDLHVVNDLLYDGEVIRNAVIITAGTARAEKPFESRLHERVAA